jgi:hypothetical protein
MQHRLRCVVDARATDPHPSSAIWVGCGLRRKGLFCMGNDRNHLGLRGHRGCRRLAALREPRSAHGREPGHSQGLFRSSMHE